MEWNAAGVEAMRRCVRVFVIALVLSALSGLSGPPAAEEPAKRSFGFDFRESSQPIRLKSDTLEWDYNGNVVTFKGNVIANQEDVTLYSDRLVMYYEGSTNQVNRIVAEGAVRIVQLDRRATAERAVFYNTEKKIVLTGRPVVTQGNNRVIGEVITILMERDWVEVQKADVTISPEAIEEKRGPPSQREGAQP